MNREDLLSSYDIPSQLTAIDDLIAQGADLRVVLRLMCLASLTAGGIKTKVLENLKREVLQVIPPLSSAVVWLCELSCFRSSARHMGMAISRC